MLSLDCAIETAVAAHRGQKDKGGWSYILHPLHVMMELKKDGASEDELVVAVLHDVPEDSEVYGLSYFETCLTETQMAALKCLTHDKADDYLGVYIPRIKKNAVARKIKIKDLEHNMLITRLKNREDLKEKDLQRIAKYAAAYEILAG